MATSNEDELSVPLEKPGAGLPKIEAWILRRFFFPITRGFLSWRRASGLIVRDGKGILRLRETLDDRELNEVVLIPRLFGIEDSSRNWSIAMTIEHITIVNALVFGVIKELVMERVPDLTVDTADVKPRGELARGELFERYRTSLEAYQALVDELMQSVHRDSRATLLHPWFGPLNTHGWHVLVAIHQGLHRRQIAEVRRRLSP